MFEFLLAAGRFTDCVEEQGPRYRQAHFRCARIVLRIAEQDEITRQGVSVTCLAFLVDPTNPNRWCMFEKAVQAMLGRKITGSVSLLELRHNLHENIDAILEQLARGNEPPLEDFSQFK
ncbi:MAG: hypothetical protein V4733_01525 [Verrucomicrobiota bacterium]